MFSYNTVFSKNDTLKANDTKSMTIVNTSLIITRVVPLNRSLYSFLIKLMNTFFTKFADV